MTQSMRQKPIETGLIRLDLRLALALPNAEHPTKFEVQGVLGTPTVLGVMQEVIMTAVGITFLHPKLQVMTGLVSEIGRALAHGFVRGAHKDYLLGRVYVLDPGCNNYG
jgi:hypothetical protein